MQTSDEQMMCRTVLLTDIAHREHVAGNEKCELDLVFPKP